MCRRRIAVLTAQIEEYGQTVFLRGLIRSAFEHDIEVSVFSMFQKIQSSIAREKGDSSIFDLVNYSLYDAIVVVPNTIHTPGIVDEIVDKIKSTYNGPVLYIDRDSEDFYSFKINASHSLYKVVSHLIEDHNLTDIGFISGKTSSTHTQIRLDAYIEAMTSHGLTVDKDRIYYGDYWYLSGESVAEKILKSPKGLPQALVCSNDRMAIGAAKYFASHGISIPEDIAIAGFDSYEDGQHSPVPLTSVKVPINEFGSYIGDCIDGILNGREYKQFDGESELFIGSSCGCNCESIRPEFPLRNSWDTEESRGRVNSVFNHMNEDMMLQNSFNGIINSIFLNVYQIRPFHGLDICINENWTDERSTFTSRLLNIVSCGESEDKPDAIDLSNYYDKKDILPDILREEFEPRSFFFYPLFFESNCFGFVSLSYTDPDIIPSSDERIWIRNTSIGLENYRRKDATILKNKIIEEGINKDPVTGLNNYSGFMNEAPALVSRMSMLGNNVGVIAFDIKGLSAINKQYGHSEGDVVINALGIIISKAFDDISSFCFCMGNGEIIALRMYKSDPEEGIKEKLNKVSDYLNEYNSTQSEDKKIEIYSSTGIGEIYSQNELEKLVNETINKKNTMKNSLVSKLSEDEKKEEEAVRTVIDNNCLVYHFQPIVNARTGEIFSYEALMRSSIEPYPNPLTIIKYAEHMDRLYDVEALTFRNVLAIMKQRQDIFDGSRKLFINSIPGQNLKGDDLMELVSAASEVKDTIVIELTEQAELSDEDVHAMKNDFYSLGIQTAIDDYGTGYSNVVNLLRYDPDYLKIDRALLSEIQNSSQKQYFVKQMVRFCHENNVMALAEGVETYEELKTVIELGVDLIQGYYTGRPQKEIVRNIHPKIFDEIKSINARLKNNDNAGIYYAGRESRILLTQLDIEGVSVIDITDNDSGLTDFEITGVPGTIYKTGIHIHGGYTGRIKLDNLMLKKIVGYNAVIVIEDGSDVTISFHGDCSFYGSIYVSEDSRVLFEGDGNANVYAESKEYYGIGSGRDQLCGTMTFDVAGSVNIIGTGMKGVGIGSWETCSLKFVNGKYSVNQLGQEAVGIGSVNGSADVALFDSKFDIVSKASNYVAVGSFSSDANININHIFFTSSLEGNHLAGMGTLEGDLSTVYITKSNVTSSVLGRRSVGIGVSGEGDAVFTVDNASVNVTVKGETSSVFGTFDQNGILKAVNSRLAGSVKNEEKTFIGAQGDNVTINSCDVSFTHNDDKLLMPDLMRMLHKGPPPNRNE